MFKLVSTTCWSRELPALRLDRGAYLGLALVGGWLGFFDDYLPPGWVSGSCSTCARSSSVTLRACLSTSSTAASLGDLISRLTGDCLRSKRSCCPAWPTGLVRAAHLFFTGALFGSTGGWADLAARHAAVLAGRAHFSRLIKVASREKRRRSVSIGAVAEESLSNAALVQAYSQETGIDRFGREAEGAARRDGLHAAQGAVLAGVDLIELVGGLIVFGFGTWALSEGRLTFGGLLVFMTFLTRLYSPIRGLSRLVNRLLGVGGRRADRGAARRAARGHRIPEPPSDGAGAGRAGTGGGLVPYPGADGTPSRASRSQSSPARCWPSSARAARQVDAREAAAALLRPPSAGSLLDGQDLRG